MKKRIEEIVKEIARNATIGSCGKINNLIAKKLKTIGINNKLKNMPNQNHIVISLNLNNQEYIIDPLLRKNYGIDTNKALFSLEEHVKLMMEVIEKEPFRHYMGKKITYKTIINYSSVEELIEICDKELEKNKKFLEKTHKFIKETKRYLNNDRINYNI